MSQRLGRSGHRIKETAIGRIVSTEATQILESAVTGKPVRALCGKKWTPGRNPDKFPVCPDCLKVYERMRDE